jgi:hypothetical protein
MLKLIHRYLRRSLPVKGFSLHHAIIFSTGNPIVLLSSQRQMVIDHQHSHCVGSFPPGRALLFSADHLSRMGFSP